MEALLLIVLVPSTFGVPGALAGWLAGRHGGRGPALVALLLLGVGFGLVFLGRSTWNSDPFGAWAILGLLAIVLINACTALGGVALARHARSRDSHLA